VERGRILPNLIILIRTWTENEGDLEIGEQIKGFREFIWQ
jgi:hypothetical protein